VKISEITESFNLEFHGDKNIVVYGFSSFNNPKPNTIILISKKHMIEKLKARKDIIFLVERYFRDEYPNLNLLLTDEIKISFACLLGFFEKEKYSYRISDLSVGKVTAKNFKHGSNFKCGNNVSIDSNVSLGSNVTLGHNVVIGSDVKIGDNVFIDSGTVIGSEGFGNTLSKSNTWIHLSHLGGVKIGDNVSIGSNCCIDRGTIDDTIIHNGVIIDNLVHIAHNVFIDENTAIAAKVGIAGSCKIGKRNMIGGMVGIIDHIKTTDDVIISATSTVNKNIDEPGVFTGIMPITQHSSWKRIAFWITKLDKILKKLNFKKL